MRGNILPAANDMAISWIGAPWDPVCRQRKLSPNVLDVGRKKKGRYLSHGSKYRVFIGIRLFLTSVSSQIEVQVQAMEKQVLIGPWLLSGRGGGLSALWQ